MAEDSATAAAPSTEQISLTCSAEYSSYALSEQNCWAITSFKGPFYEPTSRASVDIVAVIDKSGSMRGEKLTLVKETLHFIIDQLKETDRLSVVTYDTNVYVNFGLLKMDKTNKAHAKSLVDSIRKGSSTNLCGGLVKGMELISNADGTDKAQVQSVLLLTDGLANKGIKSTPAILAEMKWYQELEIPPHLPTLKLSPPVPVPPPPPPSRIPVPPPPPPSCIPVPPPPPPSCIPVPPPPPPVRAPVPPPPPPSRIPVPPPPPPSCIPVPPPPPPSCIPVPPPPPPVRAPVPPPPPSNDPVPPPPPTNVPIPPPPPPSRIPVPPPPPPHPSENVTAPPHPAQYPAVNVQNSVPTPLPSSIPVPPPPPPSRIPVPPPPPPSRIPVPPPPPPVQAPVPPPPPPSNDPVPPPPPPPTNVPVPPPPPPSRIPVPPPPPPSRIPVPPPPPPHPSENVTAPPHPAQYPAMNLQNSVPPPLPPSVPLPPRPHSNARPARNRPNPMQLHKCTPPIASKPKFDSKFEGTVYTFGFGSDHDATLLEAISTQGGGVYYYIDSNEKIPESFADCLGGLLSVVGQNLSLKLELQGGNSVSEVHANRAINWTTPNKCCEIGMGDLQSEEERDVVLELKLPALSSPQQDIVLKASLSYFNVITCALDTVTFDLIIDRKDGDQGRAKEAVDMQRNRIIATSALKTAEPLAEQNRMAEAHAILNSAISSLTASPSYGEEYTKALSEDLRRGVSSMDSASSYRKHGRNYLRSKAQAHSIQRSNFVEDSSMQYYQNRSKMGMRMKARKDRPPPDSQ